MKKILSFIISFCLLFSMVACSDTGGSNPGDNPTPQSGFEVIFFDIENGSDGTHYDGVNNDGTVGYSGVKPADCYMIKTGNTEILVDGGAQSQGSTEGPLRRISQIYQENVIKKLEQYCTDGILEYLIVTHADFDHIAGLAVDGGILDYYSANDDKYIKTIIDFESRLVETFSSQDNGLTSNGNLLLSSDIYKAYKIKRDKAIEKAKTIDKNASHIPASLFFDTGEIGKENKALAMPNKIAENWDVETRCRNFFHCEGDKIYWKDFELEYHTPCFEVVKQLEKRTVDFNYLNGNLCKENDRYYYSIPLGGDCYLNILYNWSYDWLYKHSFDSQDHNNISVCFSVVSGNNKFVSFGDLGFGESGLINYYKDTEVLKNVTCFKASHHGSTGGVDKNNNPIIRENTQELFELMNAEIVIVTGVAQINRPILETNKNQKPNTTDPIYSGLKTTAVMQKILFDNIKAGNPDAKIYCTQIAKLINNGAGFNLICASLYGDIYVKMNGSSAVVDCSNKGTIEGYVSVFSEKSKHFVFSNIKDGKLLSFNETEYYKAIYESKGRVE